MIFSKRCEGIKESVTLKLTAKIKSLRKAGKDVISYGAGEPHFEPPDFLYDAIKETLNNNFAKYTPVLGMLEVRDILSQWTNKTYNLNTDPSWFACANGAKGAIHSAFQVLLNEGDEVLFQSPYWVSYPSLAKISGAEPRWIETTANQQFRMTPDQLEKAITPKTKIFIFNSPQNPTGIAYTQSEINALVDVLNAHPDIWVVSDDIYDHVLWELNQRAHFSFCKNFNKDRLIIVQAISKSHAATGWRAGFVCAHPDVIQKINIVMGHALSHISAINQHVLQVAYSTSFDFLKARVAYYENNMKLALPILERLGAKTIQPEGAFYLFPEISALYEPLSKKCDLTVQDDLKLCEVLLEHAHVGWVPGSAFGASNYVRLSTAMTSEQFQEGLLRVETYLTS
jgi:aspartate aminotransferase